MGEYYDDESINQQAKRISALYQAGVMPEAIAQTMNNEGYICKVESGWSEVVVKDVITRIKEVNSSQREKEYPLATLSAEIKIGLKTPLALIFCVAAIFMLLGGMSFMQELWPDPKALKRGYEYTADAYIPAISVLLGTILSSAFLFWMGAVIVYLKAIALKNISHFMD